ncbi:low temperature requirement protein A [Longispora urticae]
MTSPYHLEPPADRVSNLELFFDLVFVFTITQLTTRLAADLTWLGFGRVTLLLFMIWWMYSGYAWVTNSVRVHSMPRRVLLMTAMTAFLVLALALPESYADTGLYFGLAYFVINAVHSGLLFLGGGRNVARTMAWIGPLNLASATLVLVGGWLHLPWLWVAAAALQFCTPYLHPVSGFDVRAGHFAERHSLVLIIALGESVVAIGVGAASNEDLTWAAVGAAALALTLAYHLWWAYFAGDENRAEHALEAIADPARRARLALNAFGYAYLPMLLGIVAMSAGVKKALAHPTEHSHLDAALVLAGGVALFLVGEALFRGVLRIGLPVWRLVGAAAAMATVPVGTALNPLAQLLALIVVFVAVFVTEEVVRRGSTAQPASR